MHIAKGSGINFQQGGSKNAMSENRHQNWEDLARAARVEQDPEKLIEIVEELNRVLEERSRPHGTDPASSTGFGYSQGAYC